MAVLDALNWPLLKCPRLAGFEVSPEAVRETRQRHGWLHSIPRLSLQGSRKDGEARSRSKAICTRIDAAQEVPVAFQKIQLAERRRRLPAHLVEDQVPRLALE